MKKYIKGKDGKFRGSLPDPSTVPSISAPLSRLPEVSDTSNSVDNNYDVENNVAEIYNKIAAARKTSDTVSLDEWIAETGGSVLFQRPEESKDLAATVQILDPNKVEASITVKDVRGGENVLAYKTFNSPRDAESWATQELEKRTAVVSEFDWHYAVDDEEFAYNIDRQVALIPEWQEQIDTTFGPPTGWMRCNSRGATVQRLGLTGYLVMVHNYRSAFDNDGEIFLERHVPTFEKAWAFAKFSCALTNRD